MKSRKRKSPVELKDRVIALSLTWDGARWPVRSLPSEARAFLATKAQKLFAPNTKSVAKYLTKDQIQEIRICWVPRLKGGPEVLSEPFATMTGMRVAFRSVKSARFGDILGVVYQR